MRKKEEGGRDVRDHMRSSQLQRGTKGKRGKKPGGQPQDVTFIIQRVNLLIPVNLICLYIHIEYCIANFLIFFLFNSSHLRFKTSNHLIHAFLFHLGTPILVTFLCLFKILECSVLVIKSFTVLSCQLTA